MASIAATATQTLTKPTTYFRITLLRSAIGLPSKTRGALHALGLYRRTATVFLPVTRDAAGQIMRVKELVDVEEVEKPMSGLEMRSLRRPDAGFYVETRARDVMNSLRNADTKLGAS